MKFVSAPDEQRVSALVEECVRRYGCAAASVQVIHAPYRICPVGAHIDHQFGPVSAIAVDHGILLAFVPDHDLRLVSHGYDNEVLIRRDEAIVRRHDWADYARGALLALQARFAVAQGVAMVIDGRLSEAGISSSAAVGLGYLMALAAVNDIELESSDLIELDRVIENEFLGLKNGVLDQSAIALARSGQLTIIDCKAQQHRYVSQAAPFEFLAIYSGLREALVTSGKFNNRVEECLLAGASLHALETGEQTSGRPLGLIPEAVWERQREHLPDYYQRRAAHFFSESARVLRGAEAWQQGDPEAFGALMLASGESSIHNYETGSPEMIRLFELLAETTGVFGARFSGAGFRGCAVALVRSSEAAAISETVSARYLEEFPQFRHQMWAIRSHAAAGLRLL